MRKILIITYYFPPASGIATHRLIGYANYLKKYGWQPIFYLPENPNYPIEDEKMFALLKENPILIKGKIWEPFQIYNRFIGNSGTEKIKDGVMKTPNTSWKSKFAIWIRSNFFIPDARRFWIKPSINLLHGFLKQNKIDAILSCGTPHSVHLIAQGLKKRTNIPWVADFRDPWTKIDYFEYLPLTRWALNIHYKMEKEVMNNANLVTTVSWTWAEDFKQLGANVAVITNGYLPEVFQNLQSIKKDNKKFVIAHVGTLNRDRNIPILWNALNKLNQLIPNKIKLQLCGNTDKFIEEELNRNNLLSISENLGIVDHQSACQVMKDADLLLLPINQTKDQRGRIPAKVFEYLAAKTPILMIGEPTSDCAKILKETNSGIIFSYNEREPLQKYLKAILQDKDILQGFSFDNIETYTRENQVKELATHLNQLIA